MNCKEYDIIIVGGGSSGTVLTKQINKLGYNICLIEQGPDILLDGYSISKGIPYRGSAGFHYSNIETGNKILNSSVEFWRNYPDVYPNNITYYLVMKNSVPNPEKIINIYEQYKETYYELINKYPKLVERYGTYDEFFKILDKNSEEYNNLKNLFKKDYFENIKYIVKTFEGLIDGEKFIKNIKNEIKHENIDIYLNQKVNIIKEYDSYYILKTNDTIYKSPIVILSTWHMNESLIKTIKIDNKLPIITKRLKGLCNILINSEWCDKFQIECFFECMCAGFMLSIYKNNIKNINGNKYYYAKITYTPITNIYKYTDINEPIWIHDLIRYGRVLENNEKYIPENLKYKINNIDKLIINGISEKIKGFKDNIIFSNVIYGIVCTENDIDEVIIKEFSKEDSTLNIRSYSGVYELKKDKKKLLIANYGIKFTYCIENSNEIINILKEFNYKNLDDLN